MKIDNHIPPPTDNPRNKYPYKSLDIGDSFFIPLEVVNGSHNAIRSSVCVTNRRMKGEKTYICRLRVERDIEGFRIWRIK